MFSTSDNEARKYAPLWIALLSAGAAITRVTAERVLLKKSWSFQWKDAVTALTGAAVGYLIFRKRRGNVREGTFTR